MKLAVSILIFCVCIPFAKAQTLQYVPYQEALSKPEMKKVYDMLNGKFWVLSKECYDDTCNSFLIDESFLDYKYVESWEGVKSDSGIYLQFTLRYLMCQKNRMFPEDLAYGRMSCPVIITVKRKSRMNPLNFEIEYLTEGFQAEMEMIFNDESTFVVTGPANHIWKKTQHVEYHSKVPSEEERRQMPFKSDK